MAVDKGGVFLKPLVRKEMNQYFDGYGNGRDRSKYNKNLDVSKLDITPETEDGTLTFRASIRSEYQRDEKRSKGNANINHRSSKSLKFINYLVTVRFHKVTFSEEKTPEFDKTWEDTWDDTYSKAPSIAANPAMIRCQCRDFMMTWEKWLAEKGGLWPDNKWTKYRRKTKFNPMQKPHPVYNPPYRNPDEKMGYCKHVETLLNHLYNEDMIKNG